MADSNVDVTAGTGTSIDTRTEATNGNHRQVVVLGDPSVNAGVAPVDATAGLKVDLGADNDVTVTGSVANTETRPATPTLANVTMTGASVTVQASNTSRRNLMVFNDSGVVVYIKLGVTASSTSFTVKLVDQAYYELPSPVYTGVITALGASGDIRVTEVV